MNSTGWMGFSGSFSNHSLMRTEQQKSDYRVQTCSENLRGVKDVGGRVKMSEMWERLLNKQFETKRLMFFHFFHKRPGIAVLSKTHRCIV